MSLTLGEKLQQAREARGLTISQVAEQTRISSLYLQCIENNDYRILPGGIFNKGFVKSFAKYVGVDEQEALQDYANIAAQQDNQIVENPKTYRPEVLTDDRTRSSTLPTIIFAVIILGLMTGGILFLVNYIQQNSKQTAAVTTNASTTNANSMSGSNISNTNSGAAGSAPVLSETKIELKALTQPVSVTSTVDGKRTSNLITPDKPKILEPQQNLRIIYSKDQSQNVRMTMNGKEVSLPSKPLDARRGVIDFEITNDNIKQIWESSAIASGNPSQAPVSLKTAPR